MQTQFEGGCTPEQAPRFLDWINNRGGIISWQSADLSNPGLCICTPANNTDGTPTAPPNWRFTVDYKKLVTSASEVGVYYDKEVKRLPIKVQKGDSMNFVLTDDSSRRVRAAKAEAGLGAHYVFDGEEAVILAPDKVVPLDVWAKQNPKLCLTTKNS